MSFSAAMCKYKYVNIYFIMIVGISNTTEDVGLKRGIWE